MFFLALKAKHNETLNAFHAFFRFSWRSGALGVWAPLGCPQIYRNTKKSMKSIYFFIVFCLQNQQKALKTHTFFALFLAFKAKKKHEKHLLVHSFWPSKLKKHETYLLFHSFWPSKRNKAWIPFTFQCFWPSRPKNTFYLFIIFCLRK